MKRDGSFEVQGQWFAAASYGLFQIIPESANTCIRSGIPPEQQAAVKAVYNPKTQPPDRLFNPDIAAQFGAIMDAMANVSGEKQTLDDYVEPGCSPGDQLTSCSWRRLWQRRFRVFNAGNEARHPMVINNPQYNCVNLPYDACIISAAESRFAPER